MNQDSPTQLIIRTFQKGSSILIDQDKKSMLSQFRVCSCGNTVMRNKSISVRPGINFYRCAKYVLHFKNDEYFVWETDLQLEMLSTTRKDFLDFTNESIQSLPEEIYLEIFHHTTWNDLIVVIPRVCKTWYRLCRDSRLIKTFLPANIKAIDVDWHLQLVATIENKPQWLQGVIDYMKKHELTSNVIGNYLHILAYMRLNVLRIVYDSSCVILLQDQTIQKFTEKEDFCILYFDRYLLHFIDKSNTKSQHIEILKDNNKKLIRIPEKAPSMLLGFSTEPCGIEAVILCKLLETVFRLPKE